MNKKLFVFQTPRTPTPRIEPDKVEFYDEGCIAHSVSKSPLRLAGPWKVEVRFYGRVMINGEAYEWNEVKTVTLKKQATKEAEK